MAIQLNSVYFVGVLIPRVLNDPSPAKGIPASSHTVDVRPGDAEMAGLKALHMSYWEGVRYTEDGLPIEGASAGASAGGGSGGVDLGLNTRPVNPDGSLHKRAINADGSVTLQQAPGGEGGSGAQRLARALKEEDERMERLEQLDMLGGKLLELDPPIALVFIEPLTMQTLKFVDSF